MYARSYDILRLCLSRSLVRPWNGRKRQGKEVERKEKREAKGKVEERAEKMGKWENGGGKRTGRTCETRKKNVRRGKGKRGDGGRPRAASRRYVMTGRVSQINGWERSSMCRADSNCRVTTVVPGHLLGETRDTKEHRPKIGTDSRRDKENKASVHPSLFLTTYAMHFTKRRLVIGFGLHETRQPAAVGQLPARS